LPEKATNYPRGAGAAALWSSTQRVERTNRSVALLRNATTNLRKLAALH